MTKKMGFLIKFSKNRRDVWFTNVKLYNGGREARSREAEGGRRGRRLGSNPRQLAEARKSRANNLYALRAMIEAAEPGGGDGPGVGSVKINLWGDVC